MNQKFLNQIRQLQQNKLVILRERRTAAAREIIKQLTQGYNYVDLSLPLACLQARRNPQGFVQGLQLPVYLDNLQYVPQLLPAIAKNSVPTDKVLASCTQSFALVKEAEKLNNVRFVDLPVGSMGDELAHASASEAEKLAATAEATSLMQAEALPPFSLEQNYLEHLGQREPVDVISTLWQGERQAYGGSYDAYLQRVMQSDIMYLTTVSSSEKFYSFMIAAATMAGKLVNYVKLAQAAGITPPTAKTWLSFLRGTGIVYLLQPVKNIGLKRIVSTPKLYFRDTGLACDLLGLDAKSVQQSEYLPQLEQNYMLNKIRESYINEGLAPRLRFYHDNNKKNIDVIVRKADVLYPLMLAHSKLEAERVQFAFEVLAEYAKAHGFTLGNGGIIYPACVTQELLPDLWQLSAQRL